MNLSSLLSNLNYGTILLLMLIESTVIPFPSEVVVAPAAYHAAAGYQNVVLVVVFATIGADLGAIINYAAAYYLGRPLIYSFARSKWGRMCLLNEEKVQRSEKYFADHGVVATLTRDQATHLGAGRTGKDALRQVYTLHHHRSRSMEHYTRGSRMVSALHRARKPTGG